MTILKLLVFGWFALGFAIAVWNYADGASFGDCRRFFGAWGGIVIGPVGTWTLAKWMLKE